MSKFPHVTHSQHERNGDIIRCQTDCLAISVSISSRPNHIDSLQLLPST